MSKRKQYLNDLMRLMKPAEILLSAQNPTPYMSAMHVKLHYVALRRFGAI